MARQKSFAEEAGELSERVRQALKAEVRRRDIRQLDLEQALGRSHGYFSHLFAGRLALTLEGVLEVLLAIGADPAEFFGSVFGAEERRRQGGPTFADIETTVLRTLRQLGYTPEGEEPAEKPKSPRAGARRASR
jgi:hypothetical protein